MLEDPSRRDGRLRQPDVEACNSFPYRAGDGEALSATVLLIGGLSRLRFVATEPAVAILKI